MDDLIKRLGDEALFVTTANRMDDVDLSNLLGDAKIALEEQQKEIIHEQEKYAALMIVIKNISDYQPPKED